MNTLWQLVHDYPDKEWDWVELSDKVPLSFVVQHSSLSWDWDILSERFAEQVHLYPKLPWFWSVVTDVVPLSMINKYHWLPWRIGRIPAKEAYILAYPNIEWESYDNVSLAFVMDHPEAKWCWSTLSCVSKWSEIAAHPQLPWDLESIMSRVTDGGDLPPTSFVLKRLDWPWPWEWLYDEGVITQGLLRAYPQIPYKPKDDEEVEDLALSPELEIIQSPSNYSEYVDRDKIEAKIAIQGNPLPDYWHNLSRLEAKEADAALTIQRAWRKHYQNKEQQRYCSLLWILAHTTLDYYALIIEGF
jgi:hypothetical protein